MDDELKEAISLLRKLSEDELDKYLVRLRRIVEQARQQTEQEEQQNG